MHRCKIGSTRTIHVCRAELGIITPAMLVTFGPSNLSAGEVEMHYTELLEDVLEMTSDSTWGIHSPSFLSLFVLVSANHLVFNYVRNSTLKDIISRAVRQESEPFTAQLIVLEHIARPSSVRYSPPPSLSLLLPLASALHSFREWRHLTLLCRLTDALGTHWSQRLKCGVVWWWCAGSFEASLLFSHSLWHSILVYLSSSLSPLSSLFPSHPLSPLPSLSISSHSSSSLPICFFK